jgi:hypothetical protein
VTVGVEGWSEIGADGAADVAPVEEAATENVLTELVAASVDEGWRVAVEQPIRATRTSRTARARMPV